jgi:thiol-disulfide isomerase/thioredoxin
MNKLRFIILWSCFLASIALQAQNAEKQSKYIKHIESDSAFKQEFLSHKIEVVDFWATWCKPCQFFLPEYE